MSKLLEMGMIFDGINNDISMADSPSLDGMSELTILAWIKLAVTAGNQGIVTKWNHNVAGSMSYAILSSGGQLQFYVIDVTHSVGSVLGALSAGVWYYVVGVYDGSTIRVYINGVQSGGNPAVIGLIPDTAIRVYVGQHGNLDWPFNGIINEPRIYNRALSAHERLRCMKGLTAPDGLGLHLDFQYERGSDGTDRIRDLSPYGNHGTNNGAKQVPLPDFPPQWK